MPCFFLYSVKYDKAIFEEHTIEHEKAITHYLYDYYLRYGGIDEAYLDTQNLSLITDKGMVVQIKRFFKDKEKGKPTRYAVDTYHLKRIMIIHNDRFQLILENKNKIKFPLKRAILFAIVFLLIIVLYLWIMKSFKPLSTLQNRH